MRNNIFSNTREQLGMSQTELAKTLGISRTTIGHYDHGRHSVPIVVELAMMALWPRREEPL